MLINIDMIFIEFLNDAKLCCLNGRICNDNDNFTSVSRKGRSVVDYICIPPVSYTHLTLPTICSV